MRVVRLTRGMVTTAERVVPTVDVGLFISWTAPTTNANGDSFDGSTNDRTISKYRVYYDTISPPAAYMLETTNTYITLMDLALGTWYITIAAVDGDGDEGYMSDVLTKVVS